MFMEFKEPVVRPGFAISDLGDESAVAFGKFNTMLRVKLSNDGLSNRGIQPEAMCVGTKDLRRLFRRATPLQIFAY